MDIVRRLKHEFSGTALEDVADQVRVYVKERHEAADEIERLRQRVELLEGYLNGALNLVENFSHCDTTDARKALGEKE